MEEEQKLPSDLRDYETQNNNLAIPCMDNHHAYNEEVSIYPNSIANPLPRISLIEFYKKEDNEIEQIFKKNFHKADYPEKMQYCPLLTNSKPLPNNIFEKYCTQKEKSSIRQENKASKNEEPFIKITISRLNPEENESSTYFLYSSGLQHSQKNTGNEDLIIGRQVINGNEVRPNDILLPSKDRAVSRIHCKFIYKYGLPKKKGLLDNKIMAFLMQTHHRLGKNSPGKDIPFNVSKLILEFARDLASVFGTYIKVREKSEELEKGQIYLIGGDITFVVTEMGIHNHEEKDLTKDLSEISEQFYIFLANERRRGVEIKGMSNEMMEKLRIIEKLEIDSSNCRTQRLNQKSRIPFLSLKFHNLRMKSEITEFIFLPSEEKEDFWLGRVSASDIVIPQQTISRRQNKISYSFKAGNWSISDGDGIKESANGTWLSISDELQMKLREGESDPKEISDGDIVRVSDSILKVNPL